MMTRQAMNARLRNVAAGFIGLACAFGGAAFAIAQTVPTATDQAAPHPAGNEATPSAMLSWIEGEVRRVDKPAGKITIRHAPIPNLDMPAMSMVFRAGDAAMLDQVKAGDRIRFVAEKVAGGYAVTHIDRPQ